MHDLNQRWARIRRTKRALYALRKHPASASPTQGGSVVCPRGRPAPEIDGWLAPAIDERTLRAAPSFSRPRPEETDASTSAFVRGSEILKAPNLRRTKIGSRGPRHGNQLPGSCPPAVPPRGRKARPGEVCTRPPVSGADERPSPSGKAPGPVAPAASGTCADRTERTAPPRTRPTAPGGRPRVSGI